MGWIERGRTGIERGGKRKRMKREGGRGREWRERIEEKRWGRVEQARRQVPPPPYDFRFYYYYNFFFLSARSVMSM